MCTGITTVGTAGVGNGTTATGRGFEFRDERMIAKTWLCNYCTYVFSAATAFCAFM